MNTILRFVSLALLFSPGLVAAAPDATIKQVRAVLETQVAAWNRGDVDGYMNGYARANSTEFVSGDKITRGWKTVRNRYRKKYKTPAEMGHVSFSDVRITPLSSDAAVVIGQWKLKRQNDEPHGTFCLLFRLRPEGWRIVHDFTSTASR